MRKGNQGFGLIVRYRRREKGAIYVLCGWIHTGHWTSALFATGVLRGFGFQLEAR